jgi:thiol-disulfide isomerase/thioredoxin
MVHDKQMRPKGGQYAFYILGMAIAAIIGFGAVSTFNTWTASPLAPSGLERLVTVNPPEALPDIAFLDGEGKSRSLSEWKGKVVLLNIWASWCSPCKAEMPNLDRLQAKLGGENFTVLAVSQDRTGIDAPRNFLRSADLSHIGLFIDQKGVLTRALNVPGFPLSVLIDREGRQIARLAGPAEWDGAEAETIIRAAIAK